MLPSSTVLMSLQQLLVMFGFDESREAVVVHECEYMVLGNFESFLVRIAHVVVNFSSNFSI